MSAARPKPLIRRRFTKPGIHPYDMVQWDRRDALIGDPNNPVFELHGVEVPASWSQNALNIVAQKYLAKGSNNKETSIKELFNRVVEKIAKEGAANGYFATDAERETFEAELKYVLVHQMVSFNSPVWFNIGREDRTQQASACYILSVEDDMTDILDWIKEEGIIFKGGSGAGVDISKLRGKGEPLSSGGESSGAVTFMRGADSSAGTIKSGGTTRRAAKLVSANDDHPDIEEFIWCKANEEDKARALAAAGFDMSLDSTNWASIQYQNANNSVRVSDEFMQAVVDDEEWNLIGRVSGKPVKTLRARDLFRQIAEAAHQSADPGLQYRTTINDWHTTPSLGPITSSNPCSEYMSNDDTSCNLASLNLLKFLNNDDEFDIDSFVHTTQVTFIAQEILISFASYPTELIGENTRTLRQIGTGYANAGALLMALGLPYDSDAGRRMIGAVTALMGGACYSQSGRIAERVGPYEAWNDNKDDHTRVLQKHLAKAEELSNDVGEEDDLVAPICAKALKYWKNSVRSATRGAGMRNAQSTVLAPTGTISFMLDCDTTGIEPDFSLVKQKTLVGGGNMSIVNQTVPRALRRLGYSDEQVSDIVRYIQEPEDGGEYPRGHIMGAPHLHIDHYAVFDCAVGERAINHHGHLRMMAAAQPFLSGAISKTVNLPEEVSVDDVMETMLEGWRLGLKAVAIYRDGSKTAQPLSSDKAKSQSSSDDEVVAKRGERRRVPDDAVSIRRKFKIGSVSGTLHVDLFDDGTPGDVHVRVSRAGSELRAWMDVFSVSISMALQYGMPVSELVEKFAWNEFAPQGFTNDPQIRSARSIVDYIARWMGKEFLGEENWSELGIMSLPEENNEKQVEVPSRTVSPKPQIVNVEKKRANGKIKTKNEGTICPTCSTRMQRTGACETCPGCGYNSGCG